MGEGTTKGGGLREEDGARNGPQSVEAVTAVVKENNGMVICGGCLNYFSTHRAFSRNGSTR